MQETAPEQVKALSHFVLKQSYDNNPSMNLALSLSSFDSFKERSQNTLQFVVELVKRSLESQKENPEDMEEYKRFAKIQDRLGRTVLHIACSNLNNFSLIESLITECGADPSVEDIEGQNCLHYAVNFENIAVISYFLNKHSDFIDGDSNSFGADSQKAKMLEAGFGDDDDQLKEIETTANNFPESNIMFRSIIKGRWLSLFLILRKSG